MQFSWKLIWPTFIKIARQKLLKDLVIKILDKCRCHLFNVIDTFFKPLMYVIAIFFPFGSRIPQCMNVGTILSCIYNLLFHCQTIMQFERSRNNGYESNKNKCISIYLNPHLESHFISLSTTIEIFTYSSPSNYIRSLLTF